MVDIRTIFLLLWMGNLIAVTLFAFYSTSQSKRFPVVIFLLARVAQTIAWILLWLRGLIPDAYSAMAGNGLLFIGWALEALALLSIYKRRLSFDIIYSGIALLSIPVNFIIYSLESSNIKTAIASIIPLVIFILPALIFTIEKNGSVLKRSIGILYLLFCAATSFRAVVSLSSTITFSLMTPDASQTYTFLTLFWLMLFGAFGYLLLFKEKTDQELILAAATDPLTGILNRRFFFINAEKTVNLAIRNNDPIALLMMDLDNLKMINDIFGHSMGDIVLKNFTDNTLQIVRPYDIFGRFGGDEFVILLSKTTTEEALSIAERIRVMSESHCIDYNPKILCTVSIGVCSLIPKSVGNLMDMVQTSDKGLLQAKNSGRNRIVVVETHTDNSGSVVVAPNLL